MSDENDITKELPAVTRQNRIEWLASPDGAATLDMRLTTFAQRLRYAQTRGIRVLTEDRDDEAIEAARLLLKGVFGKGK